MANTISSLDFLVKVRRNLNKTKEIDLDNLLKCVSNTVNNCLKTIIIRKMLNKRNMDQKAYYIQFICTFANNVHVFL